MQRQFGAGPNKYIESRISQNNRIGKSAGVALFQHPDAALSFHLGFPSRSQDYCGWPAIEANVSRQYPR